MKFLYVVLVMLIVVILFIVGESYSLMSTREIHRREAAKQLEGAMRSARYARPSFEGYLKTAKQEAELGGVDISVKADFIKMLGTMNVVDNNLLEAREKIRLNQPIGAMLALRLADDNIQFLRDQGFYMVLATQVSGELHEALGVKR